MSNVNVLITGANRGIGRALVEAYLSRPNYTVIACVRDPGNSTVKDLKPGGQSQLHVVKIESASPTDPSEAVQELKALGITALDIVIVNAGINPVRAFTEVKDMKTEDLRELMDINTCAFVSLFRAVHPLLKESSSTKGPKLLAISSNAASITDMESIVPARVGAYGASKAALNYLVRQVHFENPWLTCWMMNPGFVQTDTGNENARAWGMEKAPQSLGDIIPLLVGQIDVASRVETSGNFYNVDGARLNF